MRASSRGFIFHCMQGDQATFGLFPVDGTERCHVQSILKDTLENMAVQRARGFGVDHCQNPASAPLLC
jgi:hypothetical protein